MRQPELGSLVNNDGLTDRPAPSASPGARAFYGRNLMSGVNCLTIHHEQASYRSLADGSGAGPSLHLSVVLCTTSGQLDITNVTA